MKKRRSSFSIFNFQFSISFVALAASFASATVATGFLGVCEHVNDDGENFFYRSRAYNLCNRAGATWLRVDFPWADIEPTQGNWQWDKFDAIMDDAEARGIQILPILDYGSAYGGHDKLVSDDLDGWLAYVRNVLTRYRGRLPAVEVWNEENITSGDWVFWSGTTAQYVTMLRATYNAVKAIDPSVKVVLGGLAGDCESYVSDLYSNGAKGCFDVMAIHPYIGTHSPDEEWKTGSIFNRRSHSLSLYISRVRSIMNANGDNGLPIWITEHGWSTQTAGTSGSAGVSEADQAAYLARAMEVAANCGVGKYFIYNLVAYEGDLSYAEHCFGIVHHDYTAKPAFTAVQAKMRELSGSTADAYSNHVWLTFGDYVDGQTVSWASAGHWSDGAAPSADKDYLVDIGVFPDAKLLSTIQHHAATVFGGGSLTLGRVGGRAGYFSHEGWGSTVTVSRLVLNNGVTVVGGQTGINGQWLLGGATVASPASAPYTIESITNTYAWARDYTIGAALSGASGTALRGLCEATAPGGASLNLSVSGDCSAYAGGFIADGRHTTLRLGAAALRAPSGADAITLRGGAMFAPLEDGLTLSARPLAAEGGTGVIDVPAGFTFTLSCPITGTFRKTGAGALVFGGGMTGTGRIAADEGDVVVNDDTVRFLVPAPRTVVAIDSFEESARGVATAALPGWSGDGAVVAETPATGDPPGKPLPFATHTNALSFAGGVATRAYAGAFARDSQSFDFLVQVARLSNGGWREVFADDGALQLRLAFDETGAPWLLHAGASGAPAWSRLGFSLAAVGAGGAASPSFADGAWVRVSLDLDYSTNPSGLAFAQVRLDGSCLLADDGWRTPATKGAGGSWFRLPAAASAAHKVSSVEFDGALAVDDLVHAYHDPALVPDFPSGAVTSADGIPFVWFDEQGIPRDPGGDPDGDDASNRQEWRANTDPLDRASHPPTRAILSLH
ncbi:MAG: cellulase family glycosylhydrolase [Kiritimatiellae bacterium]|nr:cellulase family glycosylhydrolase [Kiritimatiellia bacterium]